MRLSALDRSCSLTTARTLDTQWSFNAEGKITGWDITIRHFALLMEKLSPSIAKDVAKELGLPAPAAQDTYKLLSTRAALDICAKHEAYCAPDPALKQWTSYDACVAGILAKPFGQWYQMGGDNAICRWIHHGMVQYRPSVHCPHIGPTGGDMCQAIPVSSAARRQCAVVRTNVLAVRDDRHVAAIQGAVHRRGRTRVTVRCSVKGAMTSSYRDTLIYLTPFNSLKA